MYVVVKGVPKADSSLIQENMYNLRKRGKDEHIQCSEGAWSGGALEPLFGLAVLATFLCLKFRQH